jgi:uncharacterized membrane protein
MTTASLNDTIMLGAITGMRSMGGPTALALRHGGMMTTLFPLIAAAEMVADKTVLVGNRTDPMPLAARALLGAAVGGTIARQTRGSVIAGGLIGALSAVISAHAAYQARTRLGVSNVLGGLLEDAIVLGVTASYASRPGRSQD